MSHQKIFNWNETEMLDNSSLASRKVTSELPNINIAIKPLTTENEAAVAKQATVLVVEDNVSNFVLIARLLGYMGIHCEWKTSGYEVIEFANTLPHLDLILMDLRLPYEDGFSIFKKIRNSERLRHIPIIAVTAEANPEQEKRAREIGFNGFLGKPLDPNRFPEQIKRILSGIPVWEIN